MGDSVQGMEFNEEFRRVVIYRYLYWLSDISYSAVEGSQSGSSELSVVGGI